MASRVLAFGIDYTSCATEGPEDVVAHLGRTTRLLIQVGHWTIARLRGTWSAGRRLACIRPRLPSRRATLIGLVPRRVARPGGLVTARGARRNNVLVTVGAGHAGAGGRTVWVHVESVSTKCWSRGSRRAMVRLGARRRPVLNLVPEMNHGVLLDCFKSKARKGFFRSVKRYVTRARAGRDDADACCTMWACCCLVRDGI